MAKRQGSGVLNRLAGKKLVFNGKFGRFEEDQLKAMAEAQQGTVCDNLSAKVDYLVLADLNASKTAQTKAMSLNGKGATIQVVDIDGFKQLAEPTENDILALLRAVDAKLFARIRPRSHFRSSLSLPNVIVHSEDFRAAKLDDYDLDDFKFEDCNFVGAALNHAQIEEAIECDFSKAAAGVARFGNVTACCFANAKLTHAFFTGDISKVDFSGAILESASFNKYDFFAQARQNPLTGVKFRKAKLKSAEFEALSFKAADFSGADLTEAGFRYCGFDGGNFSKAVLRGAQLISCDLLGVDLTGADLTDANLVGADLTGSKLAGANLKNANLRGAKLDGVDLSKVKNYDCKQAVSGTKGPALTRLDAINAKAKRIQVAFDLRSSSTGKQERVSIDGSKLRYNSGVEGPESIGFRYLDFGSSPITFSKILLLLANLSRDKFEVCYETVEVSSSKSRTTGRELRDLVVRGIAEAFGQELPPEEELAAATKRIRKAVRMKEASARQRREKVKLKSNQQIAKKIKKAVGKVSDTASFLKALELRIKKPKIDKATKMLKASGFKLFNDITGQDVSGVVKSQTDPDLVYACRVMRDGQYSCCTQNLNVCGGLRGSICKHLLVLIIGLVQGGELDPTTIDAWIAKTHSVKPELDKEVMGAIFIKYKGAEAGEVDWRPTETVPEDYYAL